MEIREVSMNVIEAAGTVEPPQSEASNGGLLSPPSAEQEWTQREEVAAGFAAGLRRAGFWRVPPNWSALDWHEELRAVALASAWQAEQEHDPSREVPMAGFVSVRVKARVLTRYRQEWRHALRFAPADTETVETLAGPDPAAYSAGGPFESLDCALQHLPEPERWILEQIFWQRRTEASIAAELHISQPAVNKRKRLALIHLHALL
jgi:DNA-directed RNA polymerase specialized sigma24 family protein